jgi:hypothetical protein
VKVNSLKRLAYKLYLGIESWLQERMVAWAPSFVNGQALYAKYNRPDRNVLLTTTSTIGDADVIDRADTGLADPGHAPIRLLTVSRIDPHVETENYRQHVLDTKGATLDTEGRALLEEDLRSPCTEEVAVFHAFSRIIREAGF